MSSAKSKNKTWRRLLKKILKFCKWIFLIIIIFFVVFFLAVYIWSQQVISDLLENYQNRESLIVKDRDGEIIYIKPNQYGYYTLYFDDLPEEFTKLLLKKEDKYFYYHLGINPVSTFRAVWSKVIYNQNTASSTITQQLAKILLDQEKERTTKNKIKEMFYSFALELNLSKQEILNMYANSIYLGNNVQGFYLASQLYFNSNPENLSNEQLLKMLATISTPSNLHPFSASNSLFAKRLANKLGLENVQINDFDKLEIQEKREYFNNLISSSVQFELNSLNLNCVQKCDVYIDKKLSEKIREIVKINLAYIDDKNASHGAVIVLKLPENQLLAMTGSPNPKSQSEGFQINMAMRSRPIGSTVKPFIYTKGFEKQLRPYTLVDDREYKYSTAEGYAFYPKNYDYQYNGIVNLHYALANSLNVPTVKVLEYIGLKNFYDFLLNDLEFLPIQNLDNYQYGIALGHLEMSLLQLAYYFSVFANEGYLKPLYISNVPYLHLNKRIFQISHVQLMNKILSDRKTAMDQFGMMSNLNLLQNNIALKTGTSRQYHDSWIVGFSPDFLVAVWVGNAKNLPMDGISGQMGAGKIWHEVMNLLINSKYNKKTPFKFNLITEFPDEKNIEYGLKNDDFEKQKNILLQMEKSLILEPHNGDTFLWRNGLRIPLKAHRSVQWFVDDVFLQEGKEVIFTPDSFGDFLIHAKNKSEEEIVEIFINQVED